MVLTSLAKLRKVFVFVCVTFVIAEVLVLRLDRVLGMETRPGPWMPWAGAVLAAAGALVRAWAAGIIVKRGEIACSGPYRRVRHPLYAGSLLIGTGICLSLGDPVVLAALLAYFGVFYTLAMIDEERKMTERFGSAYTDYMAATGRVLPSLRGFPGPRKPFDFRLFMHNNGFMALIYSACGLLLADLARRVDLSLLLR